MDEKEYHVNYQIDLMQKNASTAVKRIERLMNEKGAGTIAVYMDDDYASLTFASFDYFSTVHKNCVEIMKKIKDLDVKVSSDIQQHLPKVVLDVQDIKNEDAFNTFLNELATKTNATKLEKAEPHSIVVHFEKTQDRQKFQTEYTSTAANMMNKGEVSVFISPDWENKEMCTERNYTEGNKVKFN